MDYGPRVRFEALLVNCIGFVTAAFGIITVVRADIWSSDTDIVRSQDVTDDVSNKITAYPSRTLTEGMRIYKTKKYLKTLHSRLYIWYFRTKKGISI